MNNGHLSMVEGCGWCHQLSGPSPMSFWVRPSIQTLGSVADVGRGKPQASREQSTNPQAVLHGGLKGTTLDPDAGQETQAKGGNGGKVQNRHLQSTGPLSSISTVSHICIFPVSQMRKRVQTGKETGSW